MLLPKVLNAFSVPRSTFLISALLLALLALFPQIDLWVSSQFYDSAYGGWFLKNNWFLEHVIDPVTSMGSTVFIIGACVIYTINWLTKRSLFFLTFSRFAYLLAVFIICPIVIVNFGFKEHWGRARPYHIEQFGGEKHFTPYYQPSTQCESHCSFPSGHTVRSFYFLSIFFLINSSNAVRTRNKRLLLISVLAFGIIAAIARISMGYHFLSDVIFSAILMAYTTWTLYRFHQIALSKA